MIGMKYCTGQSAAQSGGGFEGVGDKFGAHVLSDRPPRYPP
jgi:hypothetical protein